jgi:hypothetical protein
MNGGALRQFGTVFRPMVQELQIIEQFCQEKKRKERLNI